MKRVAVWLTIGATTSSGLGLLLNRPMLMGQAIVLALAAIAAAVINEWPWP